MAEILYQAFDGSHYGLFESDGTSSGAMEIASAEGSHSLSPYNFLS